jgi:hypothetical protein
MIGVDESRRAEASVEPGVLHLGVPLDEAWELDVNGAEVAGRTGFGVTTAYDVTSDGSAELQYRSPASRGTWLIVLGALWIVALVAASRVRVPARLRPSRPAGETLIDLDSEARTTGTTGAETWVDELLSDEEAATVRREGTRP